MVTSSNAFSRWEKKEGPISSKCMLAAFTFALNFSFVTLFLLNFIHYFQPKVHRTFTLYALRCVPEGSAKYLLAKKLLVKCWWNWSLVCANPVRKVSLLVPLKISNKKIEYFVFSSMSVKWGNAKENLFWNVSKLQNVTHIPYTFKVKP